MNDTRRQLMHEAFKLVDLFIMMVAFVLAVWVSTERIAEVAEADASEVIEASTGTPKVDWFLGGAVPGLGPFSVPPDATHLDVGQGPLALESESVGSTADGEETGTGTSGAGSPATGTDPEAGLEPGGEADEASRSLTAQPQAEGQTESFLVNRWREFRNKPDSAAAQSARLDWVEEVLLKITVQNVLFVMALLVAWHVAFKSRNLYNSRRLDSTLVEVLDVLRAGLVATLMVSAIATPVLTQNLPDDQRLDQVRFTINFFLFAVGTSVVSRVLMRYVLEQMRLRGRNLRAMLIVGTNHRALRFASAIEKRPELGYYIVGFVDEEWDGIAGFKKGGHKLVSGIKDLSSYVGNNVVDEVVVALPVSSAYIYSSRIVSLCQEQGLTVRFWSQIFDSRLAKGRLDIFDDEPMLSLEGGDDESFSHLFKRMMDRTAAAILLFLISPLFAVVALAIKATSKGPVFFVQNRMGLNKRLFGVYKFRTMVEDAEARLKELEHLNEVSGPVFKLEKDPRLTPIGDFLRRTSIDELPQLINVFKGEMSLVGPRPLPERDYKGFDTDAHRRRLSVRPGITCTWQVSGRNSIPFEQWMRMDLEYIDNWSIWLDFKLLLQTIPVVLGPLLFFRKGEFMKGKDSAKDGEAGSENAAPAPADSSPDSSTSPEPGGDDSDPRADADSDTDQAVPAVPLDSRSDTSPATSSVVPGPGS